MKKTLFTVSVLIAISVLIVVAGARNVRAMRDFQKLTIASYSSAVIGTSRAARLPDSIFNAHYGRDGRFSKVFNLAFNNGVSPYGPSYNDFLMKKFESAVDSPSIFILCVDPWSISENTSISEQAPKFREMESIINFNDADGLEELRFFLDHYKKSPYTLLISTNEKYAHYEVAPPADLSVKITDAKIASYKRRHVLAKSINDIRVQSLSSLISFLSDKGSVLVVRLPVSNQMEVLENNYAPNFNALMEEMIQPYEQASYLNFHPYNASFRCPDGDHLLKEDAIRISYIICDLSRLINSPSLNKEKNILAAYLDLEEAQYGDFLRK